MFTSDSFNCVVSRMLAGATYEEAVKGLDVCAEAVERTRDSITAAFEEARTRAPQFTLDDELELRTAEEKLAKRRSTKKE